MDMERIEQMAYDIGYQRGYEKGKTDRPQGEWIPCSERLPTEEEQDDELGVLVTLGNGYSGLQYDWYRGDYWYDWDGFIIAWMPLPEPWKGAENSKECHKPQSLYYRAFCEERKDSAYCDGCEFWY